MPFFSDVSSDYYKTVKYINCHKDEAIRVYGLCCCKEEHLVILENNLPYEEA